VTLTNCILSGNASAQGGGFAQLNGFADIINSTISGNRASNNGGGVYTEKGALGITNSTISGNSAVGFGGGITTVGSTAINGSTISGNMAPAGGGIYHALGTLGIANSTISGNIASGGAGGGIDNTGGGGSVSNTIIALNTATTGGPDVFGPFTSGGTNLIGNGTGAVITPSGGPADQIGTAGSPINPMLGPLQDNGGPTMTHALLSSSPAIDRGSSLGASTDQRGFIRRVDSPIIVNSVDGADVGAYEVQPDQLAGCSEINLTVNNNGDAGAGSLRSVLANACGGSRITFASGVRGAINLTSGEMLINRDVVIAGPGANLLSVQRSAAAGTPAFRIFNANFPAVIAVISGLTIANGSGGNGGALYNAGTVTIDACTISGNTETGAIGGGIYNTGGTLTISNSTISGNSASISGGIHNTNNIGNATSGKLAVFNTTISGNSASVSGGAISSLGNVTIINSTIAGNSAGFQGGGGIDNGGGTVSTRNTIVALNMAASGPDVKGALSSENFNVIGDISGATVSPSARDQLGVTPAQLNLGPLQDNGGSTLTRALLPGSVAIDRGNSGATSDQRGFLRPVGVAGVNGGDGGDIGAFEVQALAAAALSVIEFFNSSLDHYFITWVPAEIAKLDAGVVIKGWTRTGQSFKTYVEAQPGTSPVCRYYIPPGLGDSHFFGRGVTECNATGQKNPSFVLEDPAFMQMFLPVAGVCPAGTMQIYRVFSNRPDANHRYMTDKSIRAQMVAKNWLAEGDGPDLVVMCSPV
jgi:predicted outer membrane repeat protein